MIIIVAFLTRMLFLQIYSYLKTLQLQSNFSFYYLLFDDTFVEATSSILFQINVLHKYFNILKSCQHSVSVSAQFSNYGLYSRTLQDCSRENVNKNHVGCWAGQQTTHLGTTFLIKFPIMDLMDVILGTCLPVIYQIPDTAAQEHIRFLADYHIMNCEHMRAKVNNIQEKEEGVTSHG